ATISGDIVSEWNAQSTVAFFYNTNDDGEVLGDDSGTYVLQAEVDLDGAEAYEGSVRAQKEICEGTYGNLDPLREILAAGTLTDLTTNMVFGDSADFEFTYSGTISGAKGLRLTFAQGTSVIEGDVSVLSVTINAGATLRGDGTWTMTPMSGDVDPTQASSFGTAYARAGDNTSLQGYLENNGTLYATGATGHITIDGDYVMGDGAALVLGVTSSGAVTPLTVTGAVTLGTASSSSDSDEAAAVSDEASSGTYTVRYVPEESYFRTGDAIDASSVSGTAIVTGSGETVGTEVFTQGGVIQDADILGSLSLTLEFTTPDSNTIEVTRLANAYSNLLDESASETERSIAKLLDNGAETAEGNAQTLIASLDFTTDRSVAAAAIADLKGDAHVSAVRSGFAVERLVDRTLARVPADAAVSGRHVWLQPFGGRLADNAAGAHSRTKAAGLAGGVTVTEPGKELGWQMAAAYFSESNNLHAKTRGEGFWLGASAANAIDADGTWWLDLSGRIGLANVKTERYQTVIGSTQEVKGTRWSATLGAKVGPRLELADLVSVRPAVGLIGTVLRTPSKTEDKVGGLAIEDSWYRSLRAQAGVALETAPIASAVTGFSWKWTANAGYERELMKDAGEFKAGLAGMNGTFGQRVDWNDRNRWLIGGGLELANEKGFTAAVRLEGELTHGDGAAVTGGAELRWQF
ncbi:autotransporter outer membrane beta-barrel domain-containing protein, partial [Sutterella sp.]|uniref:autotransporter outer membrane beta-barrel domain-containing protein n=1 Tax=Sutterella sp. TaxID=1981025 RepID=UPI0026E07742